MDCLESLPPRGKCREHEIAQRSVVEEERSKPFALDGDVMGWFERDGGEKRCLPGQEARLADEFRRPEAGDLFTAGVNYGDLTVDDG